MAKDELAEFSALDEAEALRQTIRSLQRRLNTAKAKSADLVEAVYQAAKDAALIEGKSPPIKPPPADKRSKRAEMAVLVTSDWHVGKHTPSFNTDVAARRVKLLGEKVAQIADIERADHPVSECHVLLAGDFCDNVAIFPGHAFEVDSTVFEQLFAAAGMVDGARETPPKRF